MNDLSATRQEQALGPAAQPRMLIPYNDRVFHRCRTQDVGEMLYADLDYTMEQKRLSSSGWDTVTQITIRDIRTHKPLKTVVIEQTAEPQISYEQFYVVRKAESDPRRMVLRHSQIRDLFYELDMTRDGGAYTVHSLQSAQPPHQVLYQYYEYEPNTPVYYRDNIYYLGADPGSGPAAARQITLCRLHLPSRRIHRYPGEIVKAGDAGQWALSLEPGSGCLTVWCGVQSKLTQIDTAKDTLRFSRRLALREKTVSDIFPAGDERHALFVFHPCTVCCRETQTGAPLFSLDVDALLQSEKTPAGFVRHLRVHQAVLSRDQTAAALVVSLNKSRYLLLCDTVNPAILLQCGLNGHHAFPLYCKQKMHAKGFPPDAIEKTEAAVRMLYCDAPLGRRLSTEGHTAQSIGRCSGYRAQNNCSYFFDHFTFSLYAESADPAVNGYALLGMGDQRGTVLFGKSRYNGSNGLAVTLYAYHIPSHTVLDTLDITGLIDSDYKAEGGFTCPALRYRGKNWPLGGSVMAALNAQGKIELIPDAGAVEDISEHEYLLSSPDRQSLYLGARPHSPAVPIRLEPGRPFLHAMFSKQQGCVDIFYLNPDRMVRYTLSRLVHGDRSPLAALPVAELRSGTLYDIVRESPDGKIFYQLYHTRKLEQRLRISQVGPAEVLRDLPLKPLGIRVLRLGYAEPDNRFITLIGEDETAYLDPFTGDILARLSLYAGEKFLLRSWDRDGEGKYFYTNAPELISVYERDLTGSIRLLEKGDARRRQYLRLYNSQQKMQELLYRPHLFAQGQQRLQALLRLSAAGQARPDTAAARPPRLEP